MLPPGCGRGAGRAWLSGGKVFRRNSSRSAALAGRWPEIPDRRRFGNCGNRSEKSGSGRRNVICGKRIGRTIARLRGCAVARLRGCAGETRFVPIPFMALRYALKGTAQALSRLFNGKLFQGRIWVFEQRTHGSIPKGLCPSAQGCEERATLGTPAGFPNPNGVATRRCSPTPQPRWGCDSPDD